MKYLLIALTLFTAIYSVSAATAEEEARFVADVKKAFDTKDAKAFLDLCWWEGVPAKDKELRAQVIPVFLAQPATKITLVPATEQMAKYEVKRDNATYRPNLPVSQQLDILGEPSPGGQSKRTLPVGEKEGKLYIVIPAPIK